MPEGTSEERCFLTHLECSACGEICDADRLWNLCPACQKPLLARYNLGSAGRSLSRDNLVRRGRDLWRYREVLPVRKRQNIFTLGEGFTPLVRAERLGEAVGFDGLFIKDESTNPTCSFKSRGMAVAVSRAFELGARKLTLPSAGNAAGAMSAYAALSGMGAHVYMPRDVPRTFVSECQALGATVSLVEGLVTDCAGEVLREVERSGAFDLSTLKEPYRLEGKKTMGFEVAEQMGWELPDIIVYPTGGGTGLVGMWKAFGEMEELGWIGPKRPRMVAVQAEGCAPIVKAFKEGRESADCWEGAETIADGLRVPSAVGDFLILRALRESGGMALAVPDKEILEAISLIGRTQGIFACPEGAATFAGFARLREMGWIKEGEEVVLFNTGSGLKYSHLWKMHANKTE